MDRAIVIFGDHRFVRRRVHLLDGKHLGVVLAVTLEQAATAGKNDQDEQDNFQRRRQSHGQNLHWTARFHGQIGDNSGNPPPPIIRAAIQPDRIQPS
jgi:hypothetical protein